VGTDEEGTVAEAGGPACVLSMLARGRGDFVAG